MAKRLLKYRKAATEFGLHEQLSRYPKIKDPGALKKHLVEKGIFIEMWTAEDIGADPNQIGFAGSPTMVKKIESITLTGTGFKEIAPTDEGIKDFVAELH